MQVEMRPHGRTLLHASCTSSREVGDIDLVLVGGRRYAVEVKDKPFSDIDVQHACERTLSAGVEKLVFALGVAAERSRFHEGALVETWAEKGLVEADTPSCP